MMQDYGATRVVQVTNIAPQATRDQMHTLFSHLGKIEDLRLYPSMRDASISIQSRVCFLKFMEDTSLPVSLHMTNTVFIDRAIIVQPFMNGDIPDELSGLEFANASGGQRGETRLPPHVFNDTNDEGMMITKDDNLAQTGLPPFPPLPPETEMKAVEEIRRTVMVWGVGATTSAQEVMDYFANGAGEVKYFRWCANKPELDTEGETDNVKTALVEFSDYGAVVPAMRLNNTVLGENTIKMYYSSQAITKPQAKSNEAALKEIEEAMKKVKEAQNLVTAAVDPLMGMLGVKGKASRSRTRSPDRSRDYYSRDRDRHSGRRRSRSRSRDRRRSRSRRRSRDRRRSRSRGRRSRSRDKRRRSRSKKRSRSRSKDRKKDSKKEEVKKDVKKEDVKEGETPVAEANGTAELAAVKVETDSNGAANGKEGGEEVVKKKSRSRSKEKERKRSRSRERKKSRSRSRGKRSKRSRSRGDRKRRSRSRERRRSRTRSRDRRRSRSRDHKHKKSKKERRSSKDRDSKKDKEPITRDYDQEEVGYENSKPTKEEKLEAVDMEISNSP